MGIHTYLNVFPPKRSLSTLVESESSIPWKERARELTGRGAVRKNIHTASYRILQYLHASC